MTTAGDQVPSDDRSSDINEVLQFSDPSTRWAAFDHHWSKLDDSSSNTIALDSLRICVRLLPPLTSTDRASRSYENLKILLVDRILKSPSHTDYLYRLAEICLSNPQLGQSVFSHLSSCMTAVVTESSEDHTDVVDFGAASTSKGLDLGAVVAYLRFLRCSYWVPPDQYHYITPELLSTLVTWIGRDSLDEDVHDTLSALLVLLSKPSVVVLPSESTSFTEAVSDKDPDKPVLKQQIIGEALFIRFQELPSTYFSTKSSKAFRTWFQWISHVVSNNIKVEALQSPSYWTILRTGLLTGFADQRKYCLAILRKSLELPTQNINTPNMSLDVSRKSESILQYEKYSVLFEIIVLDRYPNQVLACLPELNALLEPPSLVSPAWTTALLSAALNPKVQDGIRKLVGNWYLDFATREHGSIVTHIDFLTEGFLPWATQGSLFTTSLVSSRSTTHCRHGTALTETISRFLIAAPTDVHRRLVLSRVLEFIIDAGGKIFSPSIPHLLEGLLEGLKTRPAVLESIEVGLISRVSRLPGLPEVATDLCIAYCRELSSFAGAQAREQQSFPEFSTLNSRSLPSQDKPEPDLNDSRRLTDFVNRLHESQHKIIQGHAFESACRELIEILDQSAPESLSLDDLCEVLEALWEEGDRQEYPRPVVINIPSIFFHIKCVQLCTRQLSENDAGEWLRSILGKSLKKLLRFSIGRSYLLTAFATNLREAVLRVPEVLNVLLVGHVLIQFSDDPPIPKREFLFEFLAADKLRKYLPHRGYDSYYGKREWHGYAAMIDLLNRLPIEYPATAQLVFNRILQPWEAQMAPIPIISKWKNVVQLQFLLVLTETCVNDTNVDSYLATFMHILILEPWPRYRFLLEWIIARIYYRFPHKAGRILIDLASLDDSSPVHIASLMKLALLVAPFLNSEDFTLELMIQLIPFSASPKIQIRHEAHWSVPIVFDLAKARYWRSITDNPAFQALDKHVRSLDKFNASASTIRTLKLDIIKDYTLANIFQGRYLTIETPEVERVAHEDFLDLYAEDASKGLEMPPSHVPLGVRIPNAQPTEPSPELETQTKDDAQVTETNPIAFQTKAGFDLDSLIPSLGSPSEQAKRPSNVILVASLIDNPTNLGGLSRISESFGLEALYINDLRKIGHKDFKATSVTSEKHLPIHELKISAIPEFLMSMKREDYEIIGIEQTDRSEVLGEDRVGQGYGPGLGTFPKYCVIVLGSERGGITSDVLAVVDRCVEIRTVGVTRSLNVQTAGGIAVYEWWREWYRRLHPAWLEE